jgi:hypothetical protein
MSFFNDPLVQDVVERNIQKVSDIEGTQQRKLLRAFRRVRQQLQDRLLATPEGTFTQQQLNITLVQVQAAIAAINRELKSEMAEASEILSLRGIRDLVSEIGRFQRKFEGAVQPLNISTILIASEAQNFLINKHETSLDAYTEGLRSGITNQIFLSTIGRDTKQQTVEKLKNDVGRFFLGEEWKLERIVRTELHNIYNFSKLKGLEKTQETLPDLKKSLMHPLDSRTGEDSKQLAELNPVVDINQPFRFTFKGKQRIFMFPPDRPNDRSILVPFREAWDKKAAGFAPGGQAQAS